MKELDLSKVPYEALLKEIKERRYTLNEKLEFINELINDMHEKKCTIIDVENPECRLEKIVYDRDIDELFFKITVI